MINNFYMLNIYMHFYINIFVIFFLMIYLFDTLYKNLFSIENLYMKDKQAEDEENEKIYNLKTNTNNSLPIIPGEGYNTVPSNLLRQSMNISGDRYK